MMTDTTLSGLDAIAYADRHELVLAKYADPTDAARESVTAAEARQIAREDAGLIHCVVPASLAARQIEALAAEAAAAGDESLAEDCADALAGDREAASRCLAAICEAIHAAS